MRGLIWAIVICCIAPGTPLLAEQRILFIGNSFTAQWNVAGMVADILARTGSGRPIVRDISRYGVSLDWHVRENNAVEIARDGGWDVIVLQDFSDTALVEEKARASIGAMAAIAEVAGNETSLVFFSPWSPARTPKEKRDQATKRIEEHYRRGARAYAGSLAPVGRAWRAARAEAGVDLRGEDDHHATQAGAYLAALTVAMAISKALRGLEPEALWSPRAIPAETRSHFHAIATKVFESAEAGARKP
ncbi:MAG: hypothetical protein AAGE80_06405 [Pseudomonadota bacterium]